MNKILFGTLLSGSVFSTIIAPQNALAATFMVDLGAGPEPWEVIAYDGTWNGILDGIEDGSIPYSFAWNGLDQANRFVAAVQDGLGTPNFFADNAVGGLRTTSPFFPFRGFFSSAVSVAFWETAHTNTTIVPDSVLPRTSSQIVDANTPYTFAVARRATDAVTDVPRESIPTPALLPGLIGFGVSALRKKHKESLRE